MIIVKVKDLVEKLKKYDPETEVFINEESIKGIFLNEYDELIITQHE